MNNKKILFLFCCVLSNIIFTMDKQLIIFPKKEIKLQSKRNTLVFVILSKDFKQSSSILSSENTVSDIKKHILHDYINVAVPSWAYNKPHYYYLMTQEQKIALCYLEHMIKQNSKTACISKKAHRFLHQIFPTIHGAVQEKFLNTVQAPTTINYACPKIGHSIWKVPRKYYRKIFDGGLKLLFKNLIGSHIMIAAMSSIFSQQFGEPFYLFFIGGTSCVSFVMGCFTSYIHRVKKRYQLSDLMESHSLCFETINMGNKE